MKIYIAVLSLACSILNAGNNLETDCSRDDAKNVVICADQELGGLMWQDGADIFNGSEDEAKKYCEDLNFAGFSDWRLPSMSELRSIANKSREPAIKEGFENVKSDFYWSSTKVDDELSKAWFVNFGAGNGVWLAMQDRFFVRCVRNN